MPTISQKELDDLRDSQAKLTSLENYGVDNWEGYGLALESYNAGRAELEKADQAADEVAEILANAVYEPSERGAGWAFTEEALAEARNVIRKLITGKE